MDCGHKNLCRSFIPTIKIEATLPTVSQHIKKTRETANKLLLHTTIFIPYIPVLKTLSCLQCCSPMHKKLFDQLEASTDSKGQVSHVHQFTFSPQQLLSKMCLGRTGNYPQAYYPLPHDTSLDTGHCTDIYWLLLPWHCTGNQSTTNSQMLAECLLTCKISHIAHGLFLLWLHYHTAGVLCIRKVRRSTKL